MPQAGYPFHPLAVAGLDRRDPLKAGASGRAGRRRRLPRPGAAAPARRRRRGRGRWLRGRPGGPRGGHPARAARPDRGRQPPGDVEPPSRPLRAARLPGVPDRGPDRRALRGGRAAGAAGHRRRGPRRGARALRAEPRTRRACWCSGARSARAPSTTPRSRRSGGAPCEVLHASGRRDHPDLARRLEELGSPPHYRLFEYVTPFADALAAADLAVARSADRSSSWRPPASRRSSSPIRTRPRTMRAMRATWRTRARRWSAGLRGSAERLREEVGRLIADPGRLEAMSAAARGRRAPGRGRPCSRVRTGSSCKGPLPDRG